MHSHDVLWMPVHHGVLEIETFQIRDGRGLHFFWEAEVATELRDFADV